MNILKNKYLISILAFVIPLILYIFTLAPGLYFIDTGELATACIKLGIAHPTGYPLFTLIGRLFTLMPIGEDIYELNLMCAIMSAVSTFVFFHLMHFVITELNLNSGNNDDKLFKKSDGNEALINIIALSGSLVLAFSNTFWNTANSLEVYSLHVLFVITVIFVFLKACKGYVESKGKDDLRYWILFAFILGLSFSNHLTTIFLSVGFLYLYFAINGFKKSAYIRIAAMAIPFIGALTVYIYFFLRGNNPVVSWDYPVNLSNFYRHVSGKQFSVWMFSSTEAASKQFSYYLSAFPKEFFYFPLIVAIFGLFSAFKKQRKFFYFTVLLFVFNILYAINYDIHDIDTYFLLSYIVASIWFTLGLLFIYEKLKLNINVVLLLAVLFPVICIYSNYNENNESKSNFVKEYTENVFNSARPNSIVFSTQWDFWVSASFYYQYTKNFRPDVTVLDKELMRRSWYLRHIRIHYPVIYERSRQEFDAYETELFKFEKETDRYTKPTTEMDRQDLIKIQSAFAALLNGIVKKNIDDHYIYTTFEIEEDKKERFGAEFARVPEGMLIRMAKTIDFDSTYTEPDIKFTKTSNPDYYHTFLMNTYYMMFLNRASYLMNVNKLDISENYVKRALDLRPNDKTGTGMLKRLNEMRAVK
ncbi:MAG: DUF2723 domain-containing protein [Ignavibacteria bacterium]|nr:DUF2723 domain-containing protein [Ignavibacteria bacterium]